MAARERRALCDLAARLGPDAPTLTGTTADQLVTALLRAEHRRDRGEDYAAKVERLRKAPLLLRPNGLLQLVVSHEDLRRAREGKPIARRLSERDDDKLWRAVKRAAPTLLRGAPVPVAIARSDPPQSRATAIRGDGGVVITGMPLELVVALFGRHRLNNVAISGPAPAVEQLRQFGVGFYAGPRRTW